jgi:NAD(P)-dependent dehydrogenase (short-subunit alcohol dehydrogenase family)
MGIYEKLVKNLPSAEGRIFAITGTTSGTGFVAAKTIAAQGGTVLCLNRPSERATSALNDLKVKVPNGKFIPIACDLMDFNSVRNAAEEISGKYSSLYALGNNAGIMLGNDEATKDGYDKQMQTNHLSHFLLTLMLLPLLKAGAAEYGQARVVTMSSGTRHGHSTGKIGAFKGGKGGLEERYLGKNSGNLGGNDVKVGANITGPQFDRYAQSKLANSIFMHALHKKLQSSGNANILSIGCQPGVSNTGLMNDWMKNPIAKTFFNMAAKMMFQKPKDGAASLILGLMGKDENVKSDTMYGPKNQEKGPAVPNDAEDYEIDPIKMDMLWKKSEEAVGETFEG